MIFTIFKKELKDTLRDRRTLIMMLVIPVAIFPIILSLFVSFSESFTKEAAEITIEIGIVGDADNYVFEQLESLPDELGKKNVTVYSDTVSLKAAIKVDSAQIGVYPSPDFDASMKSKKPAGVTVFFYATDIGMKDRAKAYLEAIESIATQERYLDLDINAEEIQPLNINYSNVASSKEICLLYTSDAADE